jgi:ribonuclease-3
MPAAARPKVVHHLFEGVDINPHMRAVQRPQDRTAGMAAGPRMKLPQYNVVEISGAAHKQTFKVECTIAESNAQRHRRIAPCCEQAAAAALLEKLKAKNP